MLNGAGRGAEPCGLPRDLFAAEDPRSNQRLGQLMDDQAPDETAGLPRATQQRLEDQLLGRVCCDEDDLVDPPPLPDAVDPSTTLVQPPRRP